MLLKLNYPQYWQKKNLISFLLLPFSWIYQLLIAVRKLIYLKIFHRPRFNIPIIIVGNITVGGTGKTPLVVWLVNCLKGHGFKPAVISRGYGGKANANPIFVTNTSKFTEVGDEPLEILRRTNCPVVICKRRVLAVKKVLAETKCNVIISDDGLQHYALARDIEIVVFDVRRGAGNGYCLPAGPLREPLSRLESVNFIVNMVDAMSVSHRGYEMQFKPERVFNLLDKKLTKNITEFKEQKVHAVAAIGNPNKFFDFLRHFGLEVIEHPFPDHYVFTTADFPFTNEIVMVTEKDAVKLSEIANSNFWCLPITAILNPEFEESLLQGLIETGL